MTELLKTELRRESGKLYYVSFDEDGFIIVNEAILKRGRTKKVKGGNENE